MNWCDLHQYSHCLKGIWAATEKRKHTVMSQPTYLRNITKQMWNRKSISITPAKTKTNARDRYNSEQQMYVSRTHIFLYISARINSAVFCFIWADNFELMYVGFWISWLLSQKFAHVDGFLISHIRIVRGHLSPNKHLSAATTKGYVNCPPKYGIFGSEKRGGGALFTCSSSH